MGWRDPLIRLALVLLTCAVYVQVWDFDFVDLDDSVYAYANEHVMTGLTWENVRWSLSRDGATGTASLHPLTWLSLMLDAEVFGGWAGGFHLTNVVLHMANVLMLFMLLRQITGDIWQSSFVAAVFAVHPLHVESVAWISERKDVLSTFFGLVSVLGYVRYARCLEVKWYVVAMIAFALSLSSKQMLVTLPCLLFLLDYWPLKRIPAGLSTDAAPASIDQDVPSCPPVCLQRRWGWLLWEKVPFFIITVVFCGIAMLGQQHGQALVSLSQSSIGYRVSNALVVYVLYVAMTIWPLDLGCLYPHPPSIPLLQWVGATVLLVLVSVATVVKCRDWPYLLVGWLWYIGTLVPVIGLLQYGSQRMADRYTYFPSIGLLIAAAWLIPVIVPTGFWRSRVVPCFAVGALLFFTVIAWQQTATWRNSRTLYERLAEVIENSELAHCNLADIRYDEERYEEALHHYRVCLSFNPTDPVRQNGLGLVLSKLGRFEQAFESFELSVNLDPTNAIVHNNLRLALIKIGEMPHAIGHFRQALELDSQDTLAHYNLALLLSEQGERDLAIEHLKKAVQINPLFQLAQESLWTLQN